MNITYNTEIFEKALRCAMEAHAGMTRKIEHKPYILHPMEVSAIAGSMTSDINVMSAALLHDVVEDTPHTIEEIRAQFGDDIAGLVLSETPAWREYVNFVNIIFGGK